MGRIEKSVRNFKFHMLSQVITVILSFITRTCMIRFVGIEALSLNSLFTQVISAISLAEMGVGTAITYNLYKPLAEEDHEKVSELMNLFRSAYQIIGLATLVIGVGLAPWIQFFIKEISYDMSYIRLVYLLFVFQSAVSYLFSYKITLMQADQNGYIYVRISTIFKLIGTALLLVLLMLTRRYLVFLTANIALIIATDAYASHVVDQKYSYINKKAKLPKKERKEIFSNIRNIFIMQFAGRVVDSTDNILISGIISTILVGLYSNYMVVIGFFKQVSDKLMDSAYASMGNLFVSDETDKKMHTLTRLTFIFFSFACVSCAGIFACIQSFIQLWLGDAFLMEMPVVITLCFLYFVAIVFDPLKTAMRLTGYFAIGRNISFVSAMANLIVSVILGYKIGLIGIFLGTMCTYVIELITKTYYLYYKFLNRSARPYILLWVKMLSVFTVDLFIIHLIKTRISLSPFPTFFILGGSSVAITAACISLVFMKTEEYQYIYNLLLSYIKKFLKKFKILRGED